MLGVIGGSGLYHMSGLRELERRAVNTPYGQPSDELVLAELEGSGARLWFIPRHGRGHRYPPHAINYRANICALKLVGVESVLSISATGSMREEIAPGDLVVVDQFIDLTERRASTFFDGGAVAHVAFADPVCPVLSAAVCAAARAVLGRLETGRLQAPPRLHERGTYLCIEGPQFSSRGESRVYRGWGVDLVGMTNMPEAKLAREAELSYATLGLATDYDCWHASEEAVDVQQVIARLRSMIGHAQAIIAELAAHPPDVSASPARSALSGAIMTSPEAMSPEVRAELGWLLPIRTPTP